MPIIESQQGPVLSERLRTLLESPHVRRIGRNLLITVRGASSLRLMLTGMIKVNENRHITNYYIEHHCIYFILENIPYSHCIEHMYGNHFLRCSGRVDFFAEILGQPVKYANFPRFGECYAVRFPDHVGIFKDGDAIKAEDLPNRGYANIVVSVLLAEGYIRLSGEQVVVIADETLDFRTQQVA